MKIAERRQLVDANVLDEKYVTYNLRAMHCSFALRSVSTCGDALHTQPRVCLFITSAGKIDRRFRLRWTEIPVFQHNCHRPTANFCVITVCQSSKHQCEGVDIF